MKRKLQFSGPVLTASGYGVHARQLLSALHSTGEFDIRVDSMKWGETPFLSGQEYDWIRDLVASHDNPDISIQVTIPNEFKRRAPLTIGVTAGIEVDRVSPHWILKCNQEVDLVVVPSEHSRVSFLVEYQGNNGEKLRLERPIFVVSEGVDTATYRPSPALSPILDELKISNRNFVFTGLGLDKAQGKDRKNVSRLIEYFCKTFAGNPDVGLILKLSIVNGSTVDFEVVKKRITDIKKSTGCGEFPKIHLVHGRLSDSDLAGIYNDPRVISAVSLTHGEGFGLPLIEAAACGLPVMATNWSGHLDFLSKEGKRLFVPFEFDMQPIPDESVWDGVMERGTQWAVPREVDVSTKLQKMTLSSETPRKWAAELAEHIAQHFNLTVTGDAFVNLIRRAAAELDSASAAAPTSSLQKIRDEVRAKGPSLVYTMPMSAGDVFLSTGVVKALRRKHPGYRVHFATQPQYFDILKGVEGIDEIVQWQPWMQSAETLEQIFDVAYTPNMNVQMQWANWVHGGKGRNLIDEFAAQCDVKADEPLLPDFERQTVTEDTIAIHAGGQKSARAWMHWTELVKNLRANGIKVIQVGAKDDISIGDVDSDMRGKTDHAGLCRLLSGCSTLVGIDSYPMHVANVVGIKVVAIFGSSYAKSTGPKDFKLLPLLTDASTLVSKEYLREKSTRLRLIETEDRNGCERACYKDVCRVDTANPCVNNVTPERVFIDVMDQVRPGQEVRYKPYRPKIAGYTHLLNPKTHGYPYLQSIASMLGFCDEVIVVDGGSRDGSLEDLRGEFSEECGNGHLKIIDREWDAEEPGMDGMQKAFGRAMVSPDVEFLWQQDADEVVHEDDYEKIISVCKRFPADVDLIHLPVVELWGSSTRARTDRHSWKWRLSRNNLRITHGIAAKARLTDPNTGRIYAREGQSDGCEMIDMVTGEHLPHRGFYNAELEKHRTSDPAQYAQIMNEVFGKLPSVWHYSWADLRRKVKNFRDFWDKQWQVLYQTPPKPRFPDVVTDEDVEKKVAELLIQGGEHGRAPTFELTKRQPAIMEGWTK